MYVTKASGEREEFSQEKVLSSIKRAGILPEIQDQVLAHVKTKIYENIPTLEIYKHITEFLGNSHPWSRSRYSLKQAIMDLGPTGYPFEDFVAELLRAKGLSARTRVILKGECVEHEVDVLIENKGSRSVVEAKFHNMRGIKSDVKVALYVAARVDRA